MSGICTGTSHSRPQDGPQPGNQEANAREIRPKQSQKLVKPVDVVPGSEKRRCRAGPLKELSCEDRKQRGRRPGQARKSLPVKLRTADADQIRAVFVGRGPQDGDSCLEPLCHRRPVDLVQARAVASYGNYVLVSLCKHVGYGICQPRPKVGPSLLGLVEFEDGKGTFLNGPTRMLVEGLGHLPVFRVVPLHELFVLPLALRAVTEEQNGGIVLVRVDGPWSAGRE